MGGPQVPLSRGQRILMGICGVGFVLVGVWIILEYLVLNVVTEVYGGGIDPRFLFLGFGILMIAGGGMAIAGAVRGRIS